MTHLPLLSQHGLDDTLAWTPDGPVSVRQFLAQARVLAGQLPPGKWLLNVCQDRYRFAVGFAACLLTGKVSLQPASHAAATLKRIQADYPGTFCLRDTPFDTVGLPSLDYPDLTQAPSGDVHAIPEFAAEQLAAILFTSGSTGLPQAHCKTWGKLVWNGRAEAERLGLDRHPHALVGTVPVQHSYGFESTFLLALQGGCPFWSGKPFYPQDICAALEAVPGPRLLVSTPFHLATLLDAEVPLPAVDLLLSATAPLSSALAARAEASCQAPLLEIYGSTESGQLASRRTTAGPAWELLSGVELEQAGEQTWALGRHVEGRIPLGDLIELLPEGRFLLHGRHGDLINIAGKRTSLAYLNHQICALPGVRDGAFLLPETSDERGTTRLAAFAVAPGLDARQLLDGLRQRLDPVFLPRPLILLESLPRNSTGKLPRQELLALLAARKRHD